MERQATGYQNGEGLSTYFATTLRLHSGESAEVQIELHPALGLPMRKTARRRDLMSATKRVTPALAMGVAGV